MKDLFASDIEAEGDFSLIGQFISSAMGMAPLVVASSILNINLNANYLEGYLASAFPRKAEAATISAVWNFTDPPLVTNPGTNPNNVATYGQITAASHAPVTLGTANGLSLAGQALSLGLASASTTGALSATNWNTFNNKQAALSGTGLVKSTAGTISYITDNSANWDNAVRYDAVQSLTAAQKGYALRNISGFPSTSVVLPNYTMAYYNGLLDNYKFSGVTQADADAADNPATDYFSTLISVLNTANTDGNQLLVGSTVDQFWFRTLYGGTFRAWYRVASREFAAATYTPLTRGITINGTAGRISSSAGLQTFVADRTWTLDLATVGTPGTYRSVTSDAYGRITGGTNPTTVSGYGITDILAQLLAGYVVGTNTAIGPTDSILSAFQKIQGQLDAKSPTLGGTGIVKSTAGVISYLTDNSTNWDAAYTLSHNALTLGTANGLSLATQVLSLDLSSTSTTGALSSTDWNTFNGKQAALSGTGLVKSTAGVISYITDNSTNWNSAYTSAHNALTIGTANGLSLSTQVLSLALASTSTTGALSSADWNTFNSKQAALSGTGLVKSTGGTISYITDNSANWNSAVRYDVSQTLTDTEKGNALVNIRAFPTTAVALPGVYTRYTSGDYNAMAFTGVMQIADSGANNPGVTNYTGSLISMYNGTNTDGHQILVGGGADEFFWRSNVGTIRTWNRGASRAWVAANYAPALSGTANYLAKYTSSTAIGNSVVYESGGNIGIGTTTVSEKLNVGGNIDMTFANLGAGFYSEVGGNTPVLNFHANFRGSRVNTVYRAAALRLDLRVTNNPFRFYFRPESGSDTLIAELTSAGQFQGLSYVSSQATGTAPFTVASTTRVTNLNVDYLDDQHGSYYLSRANHTGTQAWSTITGAPTTVSGYGITDILSQVLTGYTVGTNTALAASDTILGAFRKIQGQLDGKTVGLVSNTYIPFSISGTLANSVMTQVGSVISMAGSLYIYGSSLSNWYIETGGGTNFSYLTFRDNISKGWNFYYSGSDFKIDRIDGGSSSRMIFYGAGGAKFYSTVEGSDPTLSTHFTTKSYVDSALSGKENSFSKGSLIQGTNITLSGTLTNRLVGSGDITISASGVGGSDTWQNTLARGSVATTMPTIKVNVASGGWPFLRLEPTDFTTGKHYFTILADSPGIWSIAAYDNSTYGTVNVVGTLTVNNAAIMTASSTNTLTNKSGNISMWTNDNGYITGINSGMVTSALGYTPYNSSNPSGYISSAYVYGSTSLTGGGNAGAGAQYISLVNDNSSPGNNMLYGTNGSGTKGWYAQPSGGGGGVSGSGSTSYLPYWNGSTSLATSPMYYNSSSGTYGERIGGRFGFAIQADKTNYPGIHLYDVSYSESPVSSALMQMDSDSRGFLVPRMSRASRLAISSPATGLLVYQTDTVSASVPGFKYYTGSGWTHLETNNSKT